MECKNEKCAKTKYLCDYCDLISHRLVDDHDRIAMSSVTSPSPSDINSPSASVVRVDNQRKQRDDMKISATSDEEEIGFDVQNPATSQNRYRDYSRYADSSYAGSLYTSSKNSA